MTFLSKSSTKRAGHHKYSETSGRHGIGYYANEAEFFFNACCKANYRL